MRSRRHPANGRRPLAGAASLAVLLMLLGASVLLAAWSQRLVLTELQGARNQLQRAQAFEAAEAGLAWAQARLNDDRPIDSACRPEPVGGSGESFRRRTLRPGEHPGEVQPVLGAGGMPLQMLCARTGTGWACHCPRAEAPVPALGLPAPGLAPSFLVALRSSARGNQIDITSTGCSHLAAPCRPGDGERADAVVRMRVTLARLPGVRTPPAAALTARGDIDAGPAALGLHNADSGSGGLAAQAGGRIVGSALRVHAPPGAAAATALLGGDEDLATLPLDPFFIRHFGSPKADWALQPGVERLDCPPAACTDALRAAIDQPGDGVRRVSVRGDLRLDGPLQLGTPARPLLLVVDGSIELRGPVELVGLVHASRLRWDEAAPGSGALLRGALLLEEGYTGNAAADLVYDPAVMRRLQHEAGTWLRVPGSWRDF